MTDHRVPVDLGDRSYKIHIGHNVLARCGRYLRRHGACSHVMIITDRNVARYYLAQVKDSFQKEGFTVTTHVIQPGERSKSVSTACGIYNRLIQLKHDSRSVIAALGGGVVGDLAGFIAATFHRGIRYCQIPTTLLAQTDASIGGKVAINHPLGKNLIGAFHQPVFVAADTGVLRTLPPKQWKNGMAEVIKYAVIRDITLFEFLEKKPLSSIPDSPGVINEMVFRCCKIKAEIVSADEHDRSERLHLNFGHTIGHAMEAVTGMGRIPHGKAVAFGMIAAGYISWKMGMIQKTEFSRVQDLIHRTGLVQSLPKINPDKFNEFLYRDKKRSGTKLRFILLSRLGQSHCVDAVEPALIREAVAVVTGK